MPGSEILLSICVPTFNRKFLLERNVSFHLQEFRKLGIAFELVLVDDCSTDDTAAYLASLAQEPEVSRYRRVRNSGFISNYAYAMQRARGRYAVFLGDDDLLIPEKVVEYVQIMENDRSIGMVQAPWLLVDARPSGGDMTPFYHLSAPERHRKGDFAGLLGFILGRHVFPEFMIVRRDVLARSISSATPFIFWAFLFTARALNAADVLFMPEPFARVTAISDDPRLQQGNKECMFEWDTYRGGLEYIASHAFAGRPSGDADRGALTGAIADFMAIRHSVALRLLVQSRHWVEAYILYHRMAAYRPVAIEGLSIDIVRTLAAVTIAATEASAFSDAPAILDPTLDAAILEMISPALRQRLTHEIPAAGDRAPRAWLRVNPDFGEPIPADDAIFDLTSYFQQFF
jgi:glycosyltransferase involved in cell wall biosynthesis